MFVLFNVGKEWLIEMCELRLTPREFKRVQTWNFEEGFFRKTVLFHYLGWVFTETLLAYDDVKLGKEFVSNSFREVILVLIQKLKDCEMVVDFTF
jgi:hypothetical protein